METGVVERSFHFQLQPASLLKNLHGLGKQILFQEIIIGSCMNCPHITRKLHPTVTKKDEPDLRSDKLLFLDEILHSAIIRGKKWFCYF